MQSEILRLNHTTYHGPKDNLCHYMACRQKILKIPYLMEFDETPRFLYPLVACDAWINFSSRTVKLRPSERLENPPFFSLSLLIHFPLLYLSLFASLPPLSNALLPLFAPRLISFSFSFSLFSYFPISFFSLSFFSSLTFLFLLLIFFPSTEFIEVGETSPHFPLSHLSSPCIFLIFLYFFSFFFITSFNTWLNRSHLFQVHHMAHAMCHFPKVPCGIT